MKHCPLELAYVTKLRAKVDTLPMETLDTYRRFGETYGPDPIVADMTGDELVDLCEGEITARYVAAHAEAA